MLSKDGKLGAKGKPAAGAIGTNHDGGVRDASVPQGTARAQGMLRMRPPNLPGWLGVREHERSEEQQTLEGTQVEAVIQAHERERGKLGIAYV